MIGLIVVVVVWVFGFGGCLIWVGVDCSVFAGELPWVAWIWA